MRTQLPILAAISLAVFACSESPSSPTDDSSSSISSSSDGTVIFISAGSGDSSSSDASSSSVLGPTEGSACEYYEGYRVFTCEDIPSDKLNLQERRAECEEDGGYWVEACPTGQKSTCIDDEDEEAEGILYKLYTDDFTCGDLMLKNEDGSEDVISIGGACGPLTPEASVPLSMCFEFPDFRTAIIKRSCTEMKTTFATECPANADLVCYDPGKGMVSHLYGEEVHSRPIACEDLGMEEL